MTERRPGFKVLANVSKDAMLAGCDDGVWVCEPNAEPYKIMIPFTPGEIAPMKSARADLYVEAPKQPDPIHNAIRKMK